MRNACLIILTLAVATPVAAQVSNADRRAFEMQERMRALGQTQRLDQTDRRISDLELRLRTQQNLDSLQQGRATPSQPYPLTPLDNSPTPSPTAYDKAREAELNASNERLRALMADR